MPFTIPLLCGCMGSSAKKRIRRGESSFATGSLCHALREKSGQFRRRAFKYVGRRRKPVCLTESFFTRQRVLTLHGESPCRWQALPPVRYTAHTPATLVSEDRIRSLCPPCVSERSGSRDRLRGCVLLPLCQQARDKLEVLIQ
jgi:hypothetical protein